MKSPRMIGGKKPMTAILRDEHNDVERNEQNFVYRRAKQKKVVNRIIFLRQTKVFRGRLESIFKGKGFFHLKGK